MLSVFEVNDTEAKTKQQQQENSTAALMKRLPN